MTFKQLADFIRHRMRMSHIYQPLLIRSLVDAGGQATLRQLALYFLAQDEAQIRHYQKTIKKMPVRVLENHGVVTRQGELVTLNANLTRLNQLAEIRALCEYRLQEFVQRRELGVWDYQLGVVEPVPESLRYRVLRDSGGCCALCGISKEARPLDVDHIVPRSRGGTNTYENLQALCIKCNRSKGNRDQTDFRQEPVESEDSCLFCNLPKDREVLADNGTVLAIQDAYPVSKGHMLVVPKRHVSDFFAMSELERTHTNEVLRYFRSRLAKEDPAIKGFNVGMNCGEAAGQTVMHAHVHLIPRRVGDTDRPQGGVRGVIPGQMQY